MPRTFVALSFILATTACGQDVVKVSATPGADYNRGAMLVAIDRFVAAGKSAPAFAALAAEVAKLRSGMDDTVAEETERKLLVMALTPVLATNKKPLAERADVLAATVWPFGLAPALAADSPDGRHDDHAAQLAPHVGETTPAYLQRVCGGELAVECRNVVPEYQGAVVGAIAIHRYTERIRNSISTCLGCDNEPKWQAAVAGWEAQDAAAALESHNAATIGSPSNWPTAGAAAVMWPDALPLATIAENGDLVVDGTAVPSNDRGPTLAKLASAHEGRVGIEISPIFPVARLTGIINVARTAGVPELLLLSRAPVYPWPRRGYRIDVASANPTAHFSVRPMDTVHVLLRGIDAATPATSDQAGALVKVD